MTLARPVRRTARLALVAAGSLLAGSLLAASLPGGVAAQGGAPVEGGATGPGVLAGRAVAAGTGEPLAGATVTLLPAEGEAVPLRATTAGPDGSWRFEGIAAGSYLVAVMHPSYAPAEARGAPGSAPVLLALTPRPIALEAIVVTAGRRLERLSQAVVPTELVSREEIRETGAVDLAAVLSERTGLDLQGGHPAGSGLMIQGMGSERVLLLVDGEPFIGRISGQVDASRLPTAMIERIEVVKGPQSTLYGSEAMGGVVNVITRSATRPEGSLTVTAGAQGRLDVGAALAGAVGSTRGTLDLGRRSIARAPGLSEGDDQLANRWDGAAKLEWDTPLRGLTATAHGMLLKERQRWRGGTLYRFGDNTQWSARLGATLERDRHRVVATLYGSSFEHLARSATSSEPVPGSGESETQRLGSAEAIYTLALDGASLDFGAQVEAERIRSDRVEGADRESTVIETFGQATIPVGPVTLVPGVRLSRSDLWGTHWSPRLAALFRANETWSFRVSVADGFRAPDFKETHLEFLNVGPGFAYTVRGNPDLGPEVSRNVSVSGERAGHRTYLRAQLFWNGFDDFIETVALGDSAGVDVFTYGNVDDGFTRGAEVEAGVTHGGWRFELGHTWLQARRSATGETLLGRPLSSARALVSWTHPSGTRASVTAVRTGRTAMERTDTGTLWRDPFLRFDVRVSRELPGRLGISFGVDNLFDAREPLWPGFTERHLYTTLTWTPF